MPDATLGPGHEGQPQLNEAVTFRGRLALVNDSLTQAQATTVDLLAISDALDSQQIPYLLIRGNTSHPVLSISTKHRAAALLALAEAFKDQPFYARTLPPNKTTALIADAGESLRKQRSLRVFRPRVTPRGELYFGASAGVQLEFWKHTGQKIKLPIENSLTRRTLLRSELEIREVQLHGRSWQTMADMFSDHAFDVNFPIDMVFSWVDGSSENYRSARSLHQENVLLGEGDAHEARYRQIDELKYALRSIHLFAPWIRKIFIATDSAPPPWLKDHPRVSLVRSHEHFGDVSSLPTHNSMAVESQLHNIKGLSEHFLYSNDDMFFGRPVEPGMFFSPGGVSRFMLSPNRIGLGESTPHRSGFENSARVNRDLLWKRFGRLATRHLEHCAAPLRRSVLKELEAEFPAEFAATAASRFRAASNISVTNSLYHYYSLFTGRAVMHADGHGIYVDTTTPEGLAALPNILAKRRADFLCLNDGGTDQVDETVRRSEVGAFLEAYFPLKAPWEA